MNKYFYCILTIKYVTKYIHQYLKKYFKYFVAQTVGYLQHFSLKMTRRNRAHSASEHGIQH